ncbi:MAG: HYR domain-containing protein [Bacteroidetes bacterium]|nr:HYR domain-containing protein [Bacteroidota bacterium]
MRIQFCFCWFKYRSESPCSNLSNGSANLTVTGAIPPYTYAWSNGATTEDVSNLAPGTYIATVTDNTGCTATASVTINAGPPFLPTAGNSGNVCPGGSLSLNASNGASYNWSGPNNFSSTDQNPIISNFPGAAYGTYAVTVTNTAGCIGTATTAVTPTCPAQALNFDGVDDLVNINPSLGNFGTGDFTVELNVRTTRTGEYIIAKRPSCNFGNFWNVFIIGNGKVAIEVGQGPGNFNYTTFTSVSSVVDGQWHHIALSRNGTLISLYIDGVLENSANPSFVADLNNTAVLRLGYSPCTNVNGTLVYQGDMDEIRIWNRALCLGELQNNQNCTLGGLQTALLAQYSFNQGIAFGNNAGITTLLDGSGNGNNGTLQSFAVNGLISNWVAPGVGNGAPCSAFVAPVIVAGSNSPVCGGTDLNLTATAGTSYQWWTNGFPSFRTPRSLTSLPGWYGPPVSGDAVTPHVRRHYGELRARGPPLPLATGSDNVPTSPWSRFGTGSGSFFRGLVLEHCGESSGQSPPAHVNNWSACMVNFALPTATDNCPSPTVVQIAGNPAGATLGVGTYSYAFEAHDISANQGFCNFTVTVADQEAPTAGCQKTTPRPPPAAHVAVR